MTKQEFVRSYQLLRQVTRGDVQTHHALAATGAVVMVHMLRPDAETDRLELLALIDSLGPQDRQRIVLIDDVDGAPFIVTRFLLEFSTLRAWLETAVRAAAARPADPRPAASGAVPAQPPAAPPPPPPPPRAAPEPGEFTRMFRAADLAGAQPSPSQAPAQPPRAAGSPPPPPVAPAAATPPSPEVPPAATPASSPPGEFTRIFGSPGAAQGATAPAGPAGPAGPPAPTPPVNPVPAPNRPPEPAPNRPAGPTPPAQGPGEFTRVFGGPPPPSAPAGWSEPPLPAWNAPKSGGDDYFARLAGSAEAVPPPPARAPDPPIAPAIAPGQAGGPASVPAGSWSLDMPRPAPPPAAQGEYTRIIAGPKPPPMPAIPAPASPPFPQPPAAPGPVPAAKPPSRTALIVVIGIIALLTIAAIVVLAIVA